MRWLVSLIVAVVSAVSVAAQPPADAPRVDGTVQRVSAAERAKQIVDERANAESRYQIGQMERVLEGAVEHGATITRDRLKSVLPPGDTLMNGENARARGFRLEGYGVFFDVIVPPFETETTLSWSIRTLDQNALGLDSALKVLESHVKSQGNTDLDQALRRVELQVNPAMLAAQSAPVVQGAGTATGSAAAANVDVPATPADPILNDPNEAYRTEVVAALKDAMLDHSSSLGIGEQDWLTIAARANDDRPRLAPADSDARTRVIRLRGADHTCALRVDIGIFCWGDNSKGQLGNNSSGGFSTTPVLVSTNTGLTCEPTVDLRHERRTLLAADENEPNRRTADSIHDPDILLAGKAENVFDSFIFQTLNQELRDSFV